jgi:hypothetical protein
MIDGRWREWRVAKTQNTQSGFSTPFQAYCTLNNPSVAIISGLTSYFWSFRQMAFYNGLQGVTLKYWIDGTDFRKLVVYILMRHFNVGSPYSRRGSNSSDSWMLAFDSCQLQSSVSSEMSHAHIYVGGRRSSIWFQVEPQCLLEMHHPPSIHVTYGAIFDGFTASLV